MNSVQELMRQAHEMQVRLQRELSELVAERSARAEGW